MRRCALLILLLFTIPAATAAEEIDRRIALTFDDLPFAGPGQSPEGIAQATGAMLEALGAHAAPALGLVTGRNALVEDQVDFRLGILRRWLDAGHDLGNHTHSHLSFDKTPFEEFLDDVIKGDLLPRMLMAEYGKTPRHYRHPFNHTGKEVEERELFEELMAERGYRVIPFTVEHSDYAFNKVFVEARQAGDEEVVRLTGSAYLEQLELAVAFAEALSRETFEREIPQVLLLHANEINGRLLGPMLELLVARGYRFVPLDEVLADPAYLTPEGGSWRSGVSWLHRWRKQLRMESRLREEPDPPQWLLQAYGAR
jgi:peptidoglycan/xylan/chitin deacetylase (PgdA/CDA1 family)